MAPFDRSEGERHFTYEGESRTLFCILAGVQSVFRCTRTFPNQKRKRCTVMASSLIFLAGFKHIYNIYMGRRRKKLVQCLCSQVCIKRAYSWREREREREIQSVPVAN
jgi:hypothetical protein